MGEQDVVVVGGGIAGLATALALKRVGVGALVLEKSEGLRTTGTSLGLFPNAWFALGVASKLTTTSLPVTKTKITNIDTRVIQEASFAKPNKGQHGLIIVFREALLEALAEELPIDSIHFSSKFKSIENQTQESSSFAIIRMEDGASIKAKAVIGCDGVHSVVARWLGLTEPVNSSRWAVHGLAVFPNGHGLNNEFQQFVTVGKRAGFATHNDKEIYWFLTCKFSEGMALLFFLICIGQVDYPTFWISIYFITAARFVAL